MQVGEMPAALPETTTVVQAPVETVVPPTVLPAPEQVVEVPKPPPVPEVRKDVVQVTYSSTHAADKVDQTRRRSFADITANPCFSHSTDYSWLAGELHYAQVRNVWTLRYASCDEDDRYGGSVTLTDMSRGDHFRSGQMVRVEGHLVDPESREIRPAYRVRSINPVNP